jgi:ABC-2 type transport system ATP-binding protein
MMARVISQVEAAMAAPSLAPAIQLIGLTKRYGDTVLAVDSVSLEVRRGEIFGFLGPNGAGKTTTIRVLIDLIRPTSGKALVFGLDCQRDSMAVRTRIGYLPGDLSVYKDLTPRQLFQWSAGLRPGGVDWTYVESLCRQLDVGMDRPSGSLSRGNRQKIGVVLALMHRPDLLVLDEPTSGLDPLLQHAVLELLREARAEGRTIFLSSHMLSEVERVCDRVGIIRGGRMVAIEAIDTLRERRTARLHVRFGALPPADAFAGLPAVTVVHAEPLSATLEVAGEMDRVIKALARCHVDSIETAQPSLEEIFMRYYVTDGSRPGSLEVGRA